MKMRWDICYPPNSGVLEVHVNGIMDLSLIEMMSREVISLLVDTNIYRSLIDLSKAKPQLTQAEIFTLPAQLETLGMRKSSKIALIEPGAAEAAKHTRLFGLLAAKRGFMLQTFPFGEEARKWLAGVPKDKCSQKTAAYYYGQCFNAILDAPSCIPRS